MSGDVYDLFGKLAHRYDLHTPPAHYKDDHAFVLDRAEQVRPGGRLLDLGCGTGVFVQKAVQAGFDAVGADISPGMIDVAAERLGRERVRVERMEDLAERDAYDVICSLSWTIHYAQSEVSLDDIICRCLAALKPGGLLLFQVANTGRMSGAVRVDREPGPAGEPDDILFIHRFVPLHDKETGVIADYVYASQALSELLTERHHLRFCDPELVSGKLSLFGAARVEVLDPTSISPFVAARRK